MELLNQAALARHQAALPRADMVRFQGAGGREASAWMFPALGEAPLPDAHAGIAARLRFGAHQVAMAAARGVAGAYAAAVGHRAASAHGWP